MADVEKNRRSSALGRFTRSVNVLRSAIQSESPISVVTPKFEKVNEAWDKLEAAQDAFIEATNIDIETHADGLQYLDAPENTFTKIVNEYSEYFKQVEQQDKDDVKKKEDAEKLVENDRLEREKRERIAEEAKSKAEELEAKFESTKAEFVSMLDDFKRLNLASKDSLKDASDDDKRVGVKKLESDLDLLKAKFAILSGIDPTKAQVITDLKKTFLDEADAPFLLTQKDILSQLQTSNTSGGNVQSTSSMTSTSSTKKEAMKLPHFNGDETMNPYKEYPIWKNRWNTLIVEYEERFRHTFLMDHLDSYAKEKIVGYESDYEGAMKKLDSFYGNPLKVVNCCVSEVMSFNSIRDGDYKSLVVYSNTLQNNYTRLQNLKLEHEMSNTSAMSMILRKFPRLVGEKWSEHLIGQADDVKLKPFDQFITWLTTQRNIWEQMAATESLDDDEVNPFSQSFFGNSGVVNKKCYGCNKVGHVKSNCPEKKDNKNRQPRGAPKVKKHWCALHLGDPNRKCFSTNCQELRRLDANTRVKLLKDNGDCMHCCHDHKTADCPKSNRKCGGGKSNLGCSKDHKIHELFCVDAKVFVVAIQQAHTIDGADKVAGVVLMIMTVRTLRRGIDAFVFWDGGCTSNFIREKFAELLGFKGVEKTLSVTTLGGVVTEYRRVIEYTCYLKDENGDVCSFQAFGMESVTGAVTKIEFYKLKRLFPHLADKFLHSLCRGDRVDILIGVSHLSWHPQRAEKAVGGDDFFVCRGRFGACVGGSHPEMYEGTRRSNDLFYVNHTYHAMSQPTKELVPHELEYCSERVKGVASKGAPSQSCRLRPAKDGSVPRDVNVGDAALCTPCEAPSQSCRQRPAKDGGVPQDVDVVDASSHTPCEAPSQSCRQRPAKDGGVPQDGGSGLRVDTIYSWNVQDNTLIDNQSHSSSLSTVDGTSCVVGNVMSDEMKQNETSELRCVVCAAALTSPFTDENLFYEADALGTVIEPKCGACRCDKCPIPGSKFSFREQQAHDIINNNLFRIDGEQRWYTPLPWIESRDVLPKNDESALRDLLKVEKMLKSNPEKSAELCRQVDEMLESGVAIRLSEQEVEEWVGSYHYLPMVLVKGKKKFRVCFDASRNQCGYPAFNKHLYKGPDRFLNNLLSVIIGFRNGRVAAAADLTKFHNQVYLIPEDIHMQRFLWRNMNTDIKPQVLAIRVNNFGVTSANCIATCALYKSADRFAEIYPLESAEIKDQTYIDDELIAAPSDGDIRIKTSRFDEICADAGMSNKGWTYTGDKSDMNFVIGESLDDYIEKVLGLRWCSGTDHFTFQVVLQFKVNSVEVEATCVAEFMNMKQDIILTRRIVMSNVARIFDPVGLLVPIILQAKLLMRELWSVKEVGWDDPMPDELNQKWLDFLLSLLKLNDVKFPRSLWPLEEVEGLPALVIFSDGAVLAYGAVAYVRWKLKKGGFWCRIIMAKCKLAPKHILSIPRMELNGAVLGTRIKNFLIKETNLQFSQIFHFVDSSTVLGYVQKEYGSFKPYEGIRIAEVQSSSEFVGDKLKGFAWVAGDDNPADLCTKPRCIEDLQEGGFWEGGPSFLREDESKWPIKLTYRKNDLEGMLNPKPVICSHVQLASFDYIGRLLSRSSSWRKTSRVMSWMIRSVLAVNGIAIAASDVLTSKEIATAKRLLIKYAQKSSVNELQQAAADGKGRYRKLSPELDDDGIWRVGTRMRNFVPFTFDGKLPAIIPNDHTVTKLIMQECHSFGHYGQDSTLCRFRSQGFWTTRGGQLAKKVKNQCVPCRKSNHKTLHQPMGELPEDRLKQPVAWGYCQMDLMGPFSCRGDTNKRATVKTWGMLIEDTNSGAVYIDIVHDYSTSAVLLALRRFGANRGWPGVLSTDPGSQLESASGILENWWQSMGKQMREFASTKNFQWKVSPPDSPWRQGKAERRIGIVKKLLRHSVGDSRLTVVELQTAFYEVANICNERPMGLSKPREDGCYDVITPNQLLMGRSSNILPDDTEIAESLPMNARYRLVKHVTDMFWQRWSSSVSPGLIVRQKWHESSRNVRVGDVVLICDNSKIKSKYKMGVIETVFESKDGYVRSVVVKYVLVQKSSTGDGKVTTIRVKRSIQRLVMILPVEEQESPVEVKDLESHVECVSPVKAGV